MPSWPCSSLAGHQRTLSLFLSVSHTHAHNQKLAQKANVRPKRVQREHRPTKVTLRAERRRCHLCPTWTHSHINAARRKPIRPPVWQEIQQGQLVQPGNTHKCTAEAMMMREEFAWIAFWLWFSLLTKRGGNRSTKTVDEVKYYRKNGFEQPKKFNGKRFSSSHQRKLMSPPTASN